MQASVSAPAARAGAKVYEHAAVTGLKRLPDGRWRVSSERGTLEAGQVLAATGVSHYNRDGVIERPESLPAPTVLRNSIGADILGSKVSTWVGPPPSHSHTTEVLRVGRPASVACPLCFVLGDTGSAPDLVPARPFWK